MAVVAVAAVVMRCVVGGAVFDGYGVWVWIGEGGRVSECVLPARVGG